MNIHPDSPYRDPVLLWGMIILIAIPIIIIAVAFIKAIVDKGFQIYDKFCEKDAQIAELMDKESE